MFFFFLSLFQRGTFFFRLFAAGMAVAVAVIQVFVLQHTISKTHINVCAQKLLERKKQQEKKEIIIISYFVGAAYTFFSLFIFFFFFFSVYIFFGQ